MSTSHKANNKRWWLWWPLLAAMAWLVAQEQDRPNEASSPSLPARAQPGRSPAAASAPTPRADNAALALVSREELLGASTARPQQSRRDLFAARPAPPPPSAPMPAVVATPSPPALPFRYVGKQWDGQAWEVYAVSGDQTYVLREGMTLDDHYRVDRIAPPHAALTYLPLGTTQTLSIGDTR